MSLFNHIGTFTDTVPAELLERGRKGRGVIVSVQQTELAAGRGADLAHVCVFTVEVTIASRRRYTATCRQAVKATVLPQLMRRRAPVAVRVDPNDRSRIALSLDEAPPTERRGVRTQTD